jgi:hypothetical protein
MKFDCAFKNPDTDGRESITVELTAEEVKSVQAVRALGKDGDVYAQALALRVAYRHASPHFVHAEPPVEQLAS